MGPINLVLLTFVEQLQFFTSKQRVDRPLSLQDHLYSRLVSSVLEIVYFFQEIASYVAFGVDVDHCHLPVLLEEVFS